MGFITTKVKSSGKFFLASVDRGEDGQAFQDAHPPLNSKRVYWGHLLDSSSVGQSPYVEYDASESAEFSGDQLEELPGGFRLIKVP